MSYLALFCFLVVSQARVHFCCAPLIVWLALIVCDVALVLCASSFVQKSLFGWHRWCCFIHCMSLDRSLRTRRISLIKPSLGHSMRIAHLWNYSIQHLGCTFKSWNVKETLVGQFALEYLNNHSLHIGHINYVLHKNANAKKLNHAETRTSV